MDIVEIFYGVFVLGQKISLSGERLDPIVFFITLISKFLQLVNELFRFRLHRFLLTDGLLYLFFCDVQLIFDVSRLFLSLFELFLLYLQLVL